MNRLAADLQHVGDRLMQARDEHAADSRVITHQAVTRLMSALVRLHSIRAAAAATALILWDLS